MNWLDAALTVLDITSEATSYIRGFDMSSEYVPLVALLLLAGGLVFWVFVVLGFIIGVCRLVMRGVWAVIDLMPAKGSGGSLPHVK